MNINARNDSLDASIIHLFLSHQQKEKRIGVFRMLQHMMTDILTEYKYRRPHQTILPILTFLITIVGGILFMSLVLISTLFPKNAFFQLLVFYIYPHSATLSESVDELFLRLTLGEKRVLGIIYGRMSDYHTVIQVSEDPIKKIANQKSDDYPPVFVSQKGDTLTSSGGTYTTPSIASKNEEKMTEHASSMHSQKEPKKNIDMSITTQVNQFFEQQKSKMTSTKK